MEVKEVTLVSGVEGVGFVCVCVCVCCESVCPVISTFWATAI